MKVTFPLSLLCLSVLSAMAQAATLQVTPAAPQPGDVLTVTVTPTAGEKITGVGMSAFDTPQVKFYSKTDGSARAFLGLPFDRVGGEFPVSARVATNHGEEVVHAIIHARTRIFPTQHITMRNSATASKMDNTAALHAEKLYVQSKMKDSYAAPLWTGNWIVPAKGGSTSAYGRKRYVNGKWWGQHNGADVRAGTGTPIVASNGGRVVLSDYLPLLRGNCVVVDHGCNVFTVYMHMSRRDVRAGQSVAKGQRLGLVGATGFVTGAHLHWEVRVGWEPVDPNKVVATGLKF